MNLSPNIISAITQQKPDGTQANASQDEGPSAPPFDDLFSSLKAFSLDATELDEPVSDANPIPALVEQHVPVAEHSNSSLSFFDSLFTPVGEDGALITPELSDNDTNAAIYKLGQTTKLPPELINTIKITAQIDAPDQSNNNNSIKTPPLTAIEAVGEQQAPLVGTSVEATTSTQYQEKGTASIIPIASPAPLKQTLPVESLPNIDIVSQPLNDGAISGVQNTTDITAPKISNTSATLSPPLIQVSEIHKQIVSEISALSDENSVEITLTPKELGRITITFDGLQGNLNRALLSAELDVTADLIRRNLDVLERELSASGFSGLNIEMRDNGSNHSQNQHKTDDTTLTDNGVTPDASLGAISYYGGGRLDIRR